MRGISNVQVTRQKKTGSYDLFASLQSDRGCLDDV